MPLPNPYKQPISNLIQNAHQPNQRLPPTKVHQLLKIHLNSSQHFHRPCSSLLHGVCGGLFEAVFLGDFLVVVELPLEGGAGERGVSEQTVQVAG